MKPLKIVLIGAGSHAFGLMTMKDLMDTPQLHGCEVVLVDIPLLTVAGPDLPAPDGGGDRPGRESKRLDGLETIRRIKSQQPQVRVVALALYATQRAAMLAAGADAFLLKGCPAQEMLDALTNHAQPSGQA